MPVTNNSEEFEEIKRFYKKLDRYLFQTLIIAASAIGILILSAVGAVYLWIKSR
jgi:hypothetical protein